ncbi:hypothetical protein [Cupriavidus sp. L7L]|uniref:hypothetical protein n=1 Tax=Cupriavidus sp. L7L TaxID=2546443 RepID=UPI001A9E2E0D|nr:hypothetical protein [Cupriavidus sp. L7L]
MPSSSIASYQAGALAAHRYLLDTQRLLPERAAGTVPLLDLFAHGEDYLSHPSPAFRVAGGITAGTQDGKSNSGLTSGKNTGGINLMIPQHESGSQDGVAHSAIADGTITIRDTANQKQDLADLKRDTAATNTTVGKNPDLKNVLDKQSDMMAAAQAAGEAVAKTVGQVANAKQEAAQDRYKAAAEAYQQDPSAENQAAMQRRSPILTAGRKAASIAPLSTVPAVRWWPAWAAAIPSQALRVQARLHSPAVS